MKRQLISDTLHRVTSSKFATLNCRAGSDRALGMLQLNFFEQILSAVLQNPEGKVLITTHPENSLHVWKKHEEHQKSSDSAQLATTTLMDKLMSLKITDFTTRHAFMISFQEVTNRYDQIADKHLDDSFKKTLLQISVMHDTALLNSWNTFTEVERATNPGITVSLSYTKYLKFLLNQSKTHDLSTPYKRPTRHAHKSNFESFYDNDNDVGDDGDSILDEFLAHMTDVNGEPMSKADATTLQVYSTFQQRRRNGTPRVQDPESEIPQPLYGEMSRELRMAWSREPNSIKKRILQSAKKQPPKQGVKKNSDLGVYMIESEGYESDASAFSEATYGYDADDGTDTSVVEATNLVANAARRRQPPNGILKKKALPRKSELPTADPRRFLANKSTPITDKDGKIVGHMTYSANMAVLNHRFDQLLPPISSPIQDNYVISVNATKVYNEPLALMDGGANGGIGGRDMRLMSYNTDGRRVNIGIAGDHQMTGKRLGTFCSVIDTNQGRKLAIFHQYAHVPEQEKSIHSKCQFQSHDILIGDTATVFGGHQRIDTPDGISLPLMIRSGLPYIRQTYPSNHDMKTLSQVEFTSPSEWNPSLNDDHQTSEEMI